MTGGVKFLDQGLKLSFGRGRARIGTMKMAFRRGADNRCLYFPEHNQGSAHHNARYRGRGAYVSRLAKPASRFFLPVRMAVGSDLQQENKGNKSHAEGHKPCQSPFGFRPQPLHFAPIS
jgi:hypothetical protein